MYVFSFIILGIAFCALQALLSLKAKNKIIKYLPTAIMGAGSLFSLALYAGLFGTGSASVIAENRYLATFIGIPFAAVLIGCVLGLIFAKVKKSNGN